MHKQPIRIFCPYSTLGIYKYVHDTCVFVFSSVVTDLQKDRFPEKNSPSKYLKNSFLGAFANLRKATISFIMSVRPSVRLPLYLHERTPTPLNGFSQDFRSEDFSKVCRENSSLIEV